jgi:DNA-binding transcriptional LysR family regulator
MEYKLDYIRTLAEERNLTRAAERLFISQPTLTKYISRLEEEMGVKLFDRSKQPIQLTRAGIIFLEEMQVIQSREAAMHIKMQNYSRTFQTFTIGIPPIRGMFFLPRVLPQFIRKYPNLRIRTDQFDDQSGSMEKALLTKDVDVAVGAFSMAYSELKYECIQEDEAFLLLPRVWLPDLTGQEGTLENPYYLSAESLNGRRFLVLKPGGGQYHLSQLMLERNQIVPTVTLEGNNVLTLYLLAADGVGYFFTTPREFISVFPNETRKLCFCRLNDNRLIQKTYIAYHENRMEDDIIQDFLSVVRMTNPFS